MFDLLSFLQSSLSVFALPAPGQQKVIHARHRSGSCQGFRLWVFFPVVAYLIATASAFAAAPIVLPALPSVHASGTQKFTVTWNGSPATTGLWYVLGGLQNGAIDQDGTYHAPQSIPSPSLVTLQYIFDGGPANGTQVGTTQLTVTNPVPSISYVVPSTITQLSTPILIKGVNFLPSSVIDVQGVPVPTTYASDGLRATAVLAAPTSGSVTIGVTNPSPGTTTANVTLPAVFPSLRTIVPGTLHGGWLTLSVTGHNFTPATVITLDGRPMTTTLTSANALTANGYLAGWKTGSTVVGVSAAVGTPASAQRTLPIAPTPIPYDTAARFATQAALGPRPGLVEHIQAIGLQSFLTEQFHQPGLVYGDPTVAPRLTFLTAAVQGNSLLRLRVAAALSALIPNQAIFLEYASIVPWEKKIETDSFGNFRTLMNDIASDSRLGSFLNLAGNRAPSDPTLHPNQNFAREFMQLFTIGSSQLNPDGSVQLDGTGQPVQTYGQDTVLDLSRALTGWELPTPVNPTFTAFNIDASQPLAAHDEYHDHGAKLLFGSVHLPAGQSIIQDRTMALDAIFNHPNLPPAVAKFLIAHLVTSNPSPAYVQRVASVFAENGKGVRGDLPSVITAILLDPEARAGDTAPSPNDGFLQDPLLFQIFMTNALQEAPGDAQALNYPGLLGQNFWYPNSIFDFYPRSYAIPGTAINSPEFTLFNNLSALHRTEYVFGFVTMQQPGSLQSFQSTSWLFNAFTNVPDIVDGLNHLLYHGQMSAAEQAAILAYCATVPDLKPAFAYAITLALNADSYNVSH